MFIFAEDSTTTQTCCTQQYVLYICHQYVFQSRTGVLLVTPILSRTSVSTVSTLTKGRHTAGSNMMSFFYRVSVTYVFRLGDVMLYVQYSDVFSYAKLITIVSHGGKARYLLRFPLLAHRYRPKPNVQDEM
jgi:hypothetical protein